MFGYGPHATKRYFNDLVAGWMIFFKKDNNAQSLYEKNLTFHPSDTHAKNCLASIHANRNEHEKALRLYESLASQDPRNPAYIFNQAFIYEKTGHSQQAVDFFKKTLAIDPHFDRAHYGLGLIYIKLNQLEEALEAFKINTKLQPMSPYGWYQMALVYMHQGNVDEAYKTHAHLLKFEPKFARGLKLDLDKLSPQ